MPGFNQNIAIIGLQEFISRMESRRDRIKDEQVKATEEAGTYVLENLPPYPPGPWTRTGKLGQSLFRKAEPVGSDVVGKVGSNIKYSPWVISSLPVPGRGGPQRGYHADHGWWTLQNEVKRLKNGIIDAYRRALRRIRDG